MDFSQSALNATGLSYNDWCKNIFIARATGETLQSLRSLAQSIPVRARLSASGVSRPEAAVTLLVVPLSTRLAYDTAP